VFGRGKKSEPVATPVAERPGAKNRPTPRRSLAEAANKRPLVPGKGKGGKAANGSSRQAAKAERMKIREAMVTGDDRHLPPRDKGPVRRFVRDYVDARRNVGEYFLIVALAVVFISFFQTPQIQLISTALLWATVLFCFADGFILSRQLKRALHAKFDDDQLPSGIVRYGVLRAFQIRRTRLPKPMVSRGQYPT
jgi:hypothetical protein